MDAIRTIWSFFLLLSLLSVPQLLGILAYLKIRKFWNCWAHLLGFLLPPGLYYFFSWLVFIYPARQVQSEAGCGMGALAAAMIVLIGTGLELFISLVIQLGLHRRHRGKVSLE